MSTSLIKVKTKRPRVSPLSKPASSAMPNRPGTASTVSPRLRVTPEQLRQTAQNTIATIVGIAGPGGAAATGQTDATGATAGKAPANNPTVLEVDRDAPTVARMMVQSLAAAPEVAAASGETAAGQALLVAKYRGMMTFYGSAVQFAALLDDARAVMGAAQRIFWQQIKQKVLAARAKGLFPPEVQDLLEAGLNQLIAEETKIQQAPVDRRARTRQKNIQHQANLAAMGNHQELLNTMIDMQDGVQLDPETAAAAADSYEQYLEQQGQGAGTTGAAGGGTSGPGKAPKGSTIH